MPGILKFASVAGKERRGKDRRDGSGRIHAEREVRNLT
jgi:hypothetical protein